LEIALLPSVWEGLGEGRSYRKEKSKFTLARPLSARGIFVLVSTWSCAPPVSTS